MITHKNATLQQQKLQNHGVKWCNPFCLAFFLSLNEIIG